jgi:uncharacterized membrane protein
MAMLSIFKPRPLLGKAEQSQIVEAIQEAEKKTSGEIRVFIESRCRFLDPLDRAREIFHRLRMEGTRERNAVLVYIALKDRQLAIYGDAGIHSRTGESFWKKAVAGMLQHFNSSNYAAGTAAVVREIGEALQMHFPYDRSTDTNELPDDIVFGK